MGDCHEVIWCLQDIDVYGTLQHVFNFICMSHESIILLTCMLLVCVHENLCSVCVFCFYVLLH